MKVVDRAFKSFFACLKSDKVKKVRLPYYLDREGFFSLILPTTHVTFKEIRVIPRQKAHFFEIEFVYEREPVKADLDTEKFLGIDLGLDNLATCVTSDGATFIVDGKSLKSYNRLYNKENARLQSEKDNRGIKSFTLRQYLNLRKRNRRVKHCSRLRY